MKNTLIRSVFALVLPVLATGCITEAFPENGTLTDSQLKEYSVGMILNGLPADMMASETAGYYAAYGDQTDFGLPSIHLRTEYMLEDIVALGTPNYNQFNYYVADLFMGANYQYCGYFWDAYYSWIKEANEVISRIDPDTENAQERDWLAQAHTYRAMFYLDLARLYIPKDNKTGVPVYANIRNLTVPLVTENTTEEMAQHNPRVRREVIYEFILDDLDAAVEYFEGTTATGYTRPTLAAAYGLMARAYLEVGTDLDEAGETGASDAFDNCIRYADLAISTSGKTPLTQSEWEDPVNGFNNGASNNAWIWGLPLMASSTTNVMNFISHMSTEATWAYGCRVLPGASRIFYQQIPDADFRKHTWLDPEWESGYYDYKFCGSAEAQENFKSIAVPYTSLKFRPASGEVSNYSVGSCADHPLMRVEEMYFIKMEATAKKDGNVLNAAVLLEDFLNTYRYTDGSYICEADNLEDFFEEMLFQKRVEFWGEGILMYDYKRLDIGITRTGSNFVPDFAYDTNGRSPQWNIVIPRTELQSNSGINDYLNNPDPSGFWMY